MTKETKLPFGKKVRMLREMRGLSQSDIEKKTGIKREYLSKVESGDLDNPTLITIQRLADGLEVNICKLFDDDDFSKPRKPPVLQIIGSENFKTGKRKKKADFKQYVAIPILDPATIARGVQYIDEDLIEGYALVPATAVNHSRDYSRYRCMKIPPSDKRMSPVIRGNSLVCLDTCQRDSLKLSGSIVALRNEENNCVISYLKISGNSIVGLPENLSEYPPIVFPLSRKSPVLGKIVWFWSQLS